MSGYQLPAGVQLVPTIPSNSNDARIAKMISFFKMPESKKNFVRASLLGPRNTEPFMAKGYVPTDEEKKMMKAKGYDYDTGETLSSSGEGEGDPQNVDGGRKRKRKTRKHRSRKVKKTRKH